MRKIFALVACLSVIATLAIGGSIAYLTDTDSDTNVMTMGNVNIVQHEKDKDGNDFVNQDMLPTQKIDKIVTVENVGKSDAYVRSFVAFEKDPDGIINFTKNEDGAWTWKEPTYSIIVDYVAYDVYEVVYNTNNGILPAGQTTVANLEAIEMLAKATNDEVAKFNGEYTVLVLSQAVQTVGFTNAADAFEAAFQGGDDQPLTAELIQKWFQDASADESVEGSDPDEKDLTIEDIKATLQDPEDSYIFEAHQQVYKNVNGTISAPLTVADLGDQLLFQNANIKNANGPIFSLEQNATVILENCNFTVPEGQKLVVNPGNAYTCQVILANVSINGVKITSNSQAREFIEFDSVDVYNKL